MIKEVQNRAKLPKALYLQLSSLKQKENKAENFVPMINYKVGLFLMSKL